MRRFLMIAPHFPPSRAVAAKRALCFARNLPPLGWEPAVIALSEDTQRDPELIPLIPEVPKHRHYRGGPIAWFEDSVLIAGTREIERLRSPNRSINLLPKPTSNRTLLRSLVLCALALRLSVSHRSLGRVGSRSINSLNTSRHRSGALGDSRVPSAVR